MLLDHKATFEHAGIKLLEVCLSIHKGVPCLTPPLWWSLLDKDHDKTSKVALHSEG